MDKKSIEQSARALKKAKELVQKFTGLSAEDVDDLNERMKAIGTPSTMDNLTGWPRRQACTASPRKKRYWNLS